MRVTKTIPLASGLISGNGDSLVFGQLEISFTKPDSVNIMIRRKQYSGKPDTRFSLSSSGFKNMVDIICEAEDKFDANWLTIIASNELNAKLKKMVDKKEQRS
jgi:hypothetical protein